MTTTGDFLKDTRKANAPGGKPIRLTSHALSQRVSFDKAVIESHEKWQLWVDDDGDLHIAPFPFEVTSQDAIYISSAIAENDEEDKAKSPRIIPAKALLDLLGELTKRPMEIVTTSPYVHVRITD